MDSYLFAVLILFVLAIADLMVGVSNDAVNFLNSAVGSRVASRRTIMTVVSLGILVGSTFSSGMMEVARKGIFTPSEFYFTEVMVIFLAVMIADVILLDMFNTFGMPTSTTVSIVFELLGASVAIAMLKISAAADTSARLADYINWDKALSIVMGILLSVVVAFTVGVVVQYVSRAIFSFHYERRLRVVGGIWSGIALTAMTYFLLVKGLKGASFVSDWWLESLSAHPLLVLTGLAVVFTLASQFLIWRRVNVLRGIVLFGTFSLAMAFAGNDLVNFIGVPVAGFESYHAWVQSGQPADTFAMQSLMQPVKTNGWLLLGAGGVMVLTLWFSKKAQSVTETEVNLARQEIGFERFPPHGLARMIVWAARYGGCWTGKWIPSHWQRSIEANFTPISNSSKEADPPAFDLIRASVNLTTASSLIAIATSWKLPLSTTYVSFMVAMGTSLADRAWDRESAVYRVSGVMNVIGGWFLTAAIAFLMAACLATFLQLTGWIGVCISVFAAAMAIWRTFHVHKSREAKNRRRIESVHDRPIDLPSAIDQTRLGASEVLTIIRKSYGHALEGLFHEDRSRTREARRELREAKEQNDLTRGNLHAYLERLTNSEWEAGHIYLAYFDITHDILQSLQSAVEACYQHVANCHHPPTPQQIAQLSEVREHVDAYLEHVHQRMRTSEFDDISDLISEKNRILAKLQTIFQQHVAGVQQQAVSIRNTDVVLRLLLDSKDLVAVATRFLKLYHRRLPSN